MTTPNTLPNEDDYDIPPEVLASAAKHCTCCPICVGCPCDGCLAGGMCDDMCTCDEDEDLYVDED